MAGIPIAVAPAVTVCSNTSCNCRRGGGMHKNGTYDPEIAEMLAFYKAAAASSDGPEVAESAHVSPGSPAPHSVLYRPIANRRQQVGGSHRR